MVVQFVNVAHPSQVVAFGPGKEPLIVNYSARNRASPTMPMKIMHYEVDSTDCIVQHSDVNGSSVTSNLNR